MSRKNFKLNTVRFQLHELTYNLVNFVCRLFFPATLTEWSLASLWDRMIKIGAKTIQYTRFIILQLVEIALPKDVYVKIYRDCL